VNLVRVGCNRRVRKRGPAAQALLDEGLLGPFGEAERAIGRWLPYLFAVGLAAFSLRGARTRVAEDG
jgi:hypothetical protein